MYMRIIAEVPRGGGVKYKKCWPRIRGRRSGYLGPIVTFLSAARIITYSRSPWHVIFGISVILRHGCGNHRTVFCQHLNGRWWIQARRAVAETEKLHDAVVKFHTYRNLQWHRAVLSAIVQLLFSIYCIVLVVWDRWRMKYLSLSDNYAYFFCLLLL